MEISQLPTLSVFDSCGCGEMTPSEITEVLFLDVYRS